MTARRRDGQLDARGNETTYEYDRADRMTRMLEPGSLSTRSAYDANGNVLVLTDANGATATSEYDQLGRKETTAYTASLSAPSTAWREVRSESFDYDANGNPLKIHRSVAAGTDPPQDRKIVRTFDALDRVETETTTLPDGGERTVSYEYHPNGTRKAMTDPEGRRTAYEYDAQNRLKRVVTNTEPGGTTSSEGTLGVTTYAYYPDDLMKEVVSPNGISAKSTYDKAGRLKTLTNGALTTVSRYDYEYGDGRGNRTKQVETNYSASAPPNVTPAEAGVQAPETTLYTYDAANRMKSVTYPADATYPLGRVVTYRYDKAGNREGEREAVPADAASHGGDAILTRVGVFDENNRLTSLTTTPGPAGTPASAGTTTGDTGTTPPPVIASGTTLPIPRSNLSIGYDHNGNETSRTLATYATAEPQPGESPTSETTTVSTYDLTDHLVEQTRDGSILARHEYDAEGRRTKKIGEDGIRQYVYDDTSILSEYNATGTELSKYDYGAERVIRQTGFGEGTRYFTFDGLGSPTALLSPTGDVATRYHLDAWGNYRFSDELAPSKNRFGFTGHYWDNEAGLYYAKARFYDPQTARFTQADSFLGTIDDPPSLHRYQYAAANPTMFVDPSGHIVDKIVDQQIGDSAYTGRYANSTVGWYWNYFDAARQQARYEVASLATFGTLKRQDRLVDQSLSGKMSESQYWGRSAANGVLGGVQLALNFFTGGTASTAIGAFVRGAAVNILGQGASDVGEVYGTHTKAAADVHVLDYVGAGALGGLFGYAGFRETPRVARAEVHEARSGLESSRNPTDLGAEAQHAALAEDAARTLEALHEAALAEDAARAMTWAHCAAAVEDLSPALSSSDPRFSPTTYYSYDQLHSRIKEAGLSGQGIGLDAHHLLAKRFASALGLRKGDIISVPLTPRWHRNLGGVREIGQGANIDAMITSDMRKNGVTPSAATAAEIWNAHKTVYLKLGRPDWANAIYEAYFRGQGITF